MTASPDWWKDFFSGLVIPFWQGAIPDETTRADADVFAQKLALRPGSRLLDVPCGHGRFALEFARRGCRVTGVDYSAGFLAAARAGAEREGLTIAWRQADMRDLPRAAFDAVLCAGNSFGYLDDAGNTAFLAAASSALVPGGRFLLDWGGAAESIFPNFRIDRDMTAGGVRFAGHNAYDPRTGRITSRYTLSREGVTEVREASQRVYTVSQVLGMSQDAGFSKLECFGAASATDPSSPEPYVLGSPRLLLVATKG